MKIVECSKESLNFKFTDDDDLRRKLTKIYTVEGHSPVINMKGDVIEVWVEDAVYVPVRDDFNRATNLCNKHQYDQAEPILKSVIKRCPLHTEAFRILGQIEMDRGNYEKSIDYLLSALVVEPTHLWSLILMGNVYSLKGDIETAGIYHRKALEYNPKNLQALNNVGVNLMRYKKYEEALALFEEALSINDSYMNSYLGMAICYHFLQRYEECIEVSVKGLKKGETLPQDKNVGGELIRNLVSSCQHIVQDFDYSIEIEMQKKKIAEMTEVPTRVSQDKNLSVNALMEYYIAHHRDYNRVVYNPERPYHEHMLMHEFTHLEMNLEASKAGSNKFIVGGEKEQETFLKWLSPELGRLRSKLTKEHLQVFVDQMRNGIMLQATNCPLDLLVEDRIYKNYPKMRPLQLLSLYRMELTNIEAVNEAAKTEIPKKLISANRIMNIVGAMHLQELYGIDLAAHYKPNASEMAAAEDLYEEYKAYREDYKPGEEYNMLSYFAENLGLSDYFRLVDEESYSRADRLAKALDPKEKIDPKSKEEQNAAFAENNGDSNSAVTMMMTMYMHGALKYMSGMPKADVQGIAFEAASVGMSGIKPENKYTLKTIPNKVFGGYELLAYYYVSWAIALPDKVDLLGMPFKKAYEAAKEKFRKGE